MTYLCVDASHFLCLGFVVLLDLGHHSFYLTGKITDLIFVTDISKPPSCPGGALVTCMGRVWGLACGKGPGHGSVSTSYCPRNPLGSFLPPCQVISPSLGTAHAAPSEVRRLPFSHLNLTHSYPSRPLLTCDFLQLLESSDVLSSMQSGVWSCLFHCSFPSIRTAPETQKYVRHE